MREGRPSRTAEYMAFFRALESQRPVAARLFEDPYAKRFLGGRLRAALLAARPPGAGSVVDSYIDRRWPGPRPSGIARTRVIDDAVRDAVSAGARQVVLLGAGYDSRPYRLGVSGVTFFEVDMPSTQAVKRRHVEASEQVRFVATDFGAGHPGAELRAAGFEPGACTCFLWEGVLSYLELDAIDAMLRWIATAGGAGSSLVFTYVDARTLDAGAVPWRKAVERVDEPFRTALDPAELAVFLGERGLELRWDESTGTAARRLGVAFDGRIPDLQRVALAELGSDAARRGQTPRATRGARGV